MDTCTGVLVDTCTGCVSGHMYRVCVRTHVQDVLVDTCTGCVSGHMYRVC